VAQRDIVVIGASSGGVEALTRLVRALPERFPAAVFVVLHVSPDARSFLPAILNRAGSLPAAHAVDQEPVRCGRIYVAPPGAQTYVNRGRISVRRGPRENGQRPAVDPLFRSAAHFYGARAIGVVLSGSLDDGSVGLRAIKEGGGIAIVQDPQEALSPSMPSNALNAAEVDYILKTDEIAAALVRLVEEPIPPSQSATAVPKEIPLETVEELPDSPTQSDEGLRRPDQLGKPSHFTCPDCSGTLYEIQEGDGFRFRCRVGHAYSEHSMQSAQHENVERALWVALRALQERSSMLEKLAELARRRGHAGIAAAYQERSKSVAEDAAAIHSVIVANQPPEPGEEGAA
jgi:two-component system chemotaxis response regulator CheB